MSQESKFALDGDLFDKLVEASPSAMIMIDSEGRILIANLQAEKLFAYSKSELLQLTIEKLVPERYQENHPNLRKMFFLNPQTRSMGVGRELFGRRKDGTEIPIEIGLNPLEIKGQTFVLASIIDITERKRSEDRFRLAVEAAPNAMIMIDAEGKIVMVNKQTERLFGYERNQLLGKPIEVLVPDRFRSQHPHVRKDFIKHPQVRSMGAGRDLFGRKVDGEEIPVEIGLTPVGEGANLFVLASIIDITERKKNEQLLAAKEAALEASHVKSRFLATMSHEIRTPLNGIIGLTNLLFHMDMPEVQREYLQGIRASSDALLGLINDILDLSKIEAGKMDMEVANFNLGKIISDAVSIMNSTAKLKNLKLLVDMDPTLPEWFKGDMNKLKQVLINLIGNAIKFTEQGSIIVKARKANATETSHTLLIDVEDTGIGISELVKSRLFEVFTQGDSSTSRKYGGTGLGLSISKKLIEMMDGKIEVSSGLGKGSCFRIFLNLPLGEPVTSEVIEKSTLPVNDLKDCRILVVEDNLINQKVALGILNSFGLDGQAVGNGLEACQIIEKIPFDLILMDCHMPEMDGYEATIKIRQSFNPKLQVIPIIAMTANVMQGDREKCLEVGMNDYISKPIDTDELENVLKKWLSKTDESKKNLDSEVFNTLQMLQKKLKIEMVDELIKIYTETTPPALDKIEKAYRDKDIKLVLLESHSLKSSSAVLGLNEFSSSAEVIETSCRENKLDNLESSIQNLRSAFRKSLDILKTNRAKLSK